MILPGRKPCAVLAPMAGYTDHPMRALCASLGADYAVTEMVSAAAICYGDGNSFALARLYPDDPPCAIQLFGHDPEQMRRAAGAVLARARETGVMPAAVDLNMGCPVRKIVSSGDGSALMRDPALAAALVRAAKEGAEPYGIPVTVKLRAGWDAENVNAAELAAAAAEAGAEAVCVHGRTREQMYGGRSDGAVARAVRAALDPAIPVTASGDVTDADSFFALVRSTGCEGAAIGRAAVGDPWIFAAIRARKSGADFVPPSEDERRETSLALAKRIVEEKGPGAIRECRGRIARFFGGMRGAAAVRAAIHTADSIEELEEIIGAPFGAAGEETRHET